MSENITLNGKFMPPGDKSISHRMALISLLANGKIRLKNFSPCADVNSSLNAIKLLGADVSKDNDEIIINGINKKVNTYAEIDCGNSGTTMRLLIGILSGLSGKFILNGDSSLQKRPMERIALPLRQMGADIQTNNGKAPIIINGCNLHGINYTLPVASAQLKSAILLAGLQAKDSTIVVEPVKSRDHTERLLEKIGANIEKVENSWKINSSEITMPQNFHVPGDTSSAAFFLCASSIIQGSNVSAEAVLLNPTRTGFIDVLKRMNVKIEIENWSEEPEPWGLVNTSFSPELISCEIQSHEIPSLVDEVPILSLVATQAKGTTVFQGVKELRIKETDRLNAVATQLGKMGADIQAQEDTLIIKGPSKLKPVKELDSFGDHRIAMTLRLASILANSNPIIKDEESINISYPNFHETLKALSN